VTPQNLAGSLNNYPSCTTPPMATTNHLLPSFTAPT